MNVKLEYLYRDAGNYKSWGEVIFSNPRDLPVDKIAKLAQKAALEAIYFEAEHLAVPDLHFEDFNKELDHQWHEIYSFKPTSDEITDVQKRSIEEFLHQLSGQ